MNLSESERWKAPAKGRVCIVCGEPCARFRNGPWLMSLVAGALEYGFTIKAPAGTSYHDKCGDRLGYLIQKKRDRAKGLTCSAATALDANSQASPVVTTAGNGRTNAPEKTPASSAPL